jgi:hypothetical protein
MRTQILKRAGLAVLGMLTLSAPVTVSAGDIRANVPFSFTVNKKVLPPGTYNVTSGTAHSLLIRGYGSAAVAMGQHAESATSTSPKLVFHRYGDEYILREVWMGRASGYQLPQTSRERELAGNRGGTNTATASFERVEVAIQ